jgi:hypothetical protein
MYISMLGYFKLDFGTNKTISLSPTARFACIRLPITLSL